MTSLAVHLNNCMYLLQLFSAATVEERILANAAKKRKLEAVVCAHMGHGAGAELSSAELRACLTHGGFVSGHHQSHGSSAPTDAVGYFAFAGTSAYDCQCSPPVQPTRDTKLTLFCF